MIGSISTKSLMKLGTEFQGRNYDMMISHTTIVYTRYILLEWLRRNENDEKTSTQTMPGENWMVVQKPN